MSCLCVLCVSTGQVDSFALSWHESLCLSTAAIRTGCSAVTIDRGAKQT